MHRPDLTEHLGIRKNGRDVAFPENHVLSGIDLAKSKRRVMTANILGSHAAPSDLNAFGARLSRLHPC